jgi:RNA-binding protein Tab2/Atab2
MLTILLLLFNANTQVDVAVKPCRTTYAMFNWLEERERDVYPQMEGHSPTMTQGSFFDIR